MRLKFLLLLVVFSFIFSGWSQGLRFNPNNYLISDRTSYSVFEQNQPKFGKEFSMSFKLALNNIHTFGEVFSIKDKINNNFISLSYIDFDNSIQKLKLNYNSESNILTIPLTDADLSFKKWINLKVSFDSSSKTITLEVNGKSYVKKGFSFTSNISPEINFGKHESNIEVPSMSIKDLRIQNGKINYTFPLNESRGEKVYDSSGEFYGMVKNPNWLINDSYHWKKRQTFFFKEISAVTFDEKNQRFISISSDSIAFYNIEKQTTKKIKLKQKNPIPMRLGTSILNPSSNKLYVYELNDVVINSPTIASLDLDTFEWQIISNLQLPIQHHHHDSFFDNTKNGFYVFGGFGNQKYTNELNYFDLDLRQWATIVLKGDSMSPRFFSGLCKINKDEILIFGGIGNKSGDQTIGKRYYSDLYKINLNSKKISKLWDNSSKNKKNVSVRNMILSKDSKSFYTLCYPEYISSTLLQLVSYSIKDGKNKILGDSIPMNSENILTNANLYYNKFTKELYCTTQEYQINGQNKTSFYSIKAPPISKEILVKNQENNDYNHLFLIIFFILIAIVILLIVYRKRLNQNKEIANQKIPNLNLEEKKTVITENAVYLFGNFKVFNNKGNDITYLFSPKIKQLFLLLLLNIKNEESGISSELIYDVLWPDSDYNKAKNLKNVTINLLRKNLEEIEGIQLVYSDKVFKLEFEDSFYCDYFDFFNQIQILKKGVNIENSIASLLSIIGNGCFLKSIEDVYFDAFKTEYENDIFEILPNLIQTTFNNKDFVTTIAIANSLFKIDSVNEIAFYYKIHSLLKMKNSIDAKKCFNYFIIEYKKIMSDEFSKTFLEVTKTIPKELI
jgi:two-component SAPR family response regulator